LVDRKITAVRDVGAAPRGLNRSGGPAPE